MKHGTCHHLQEMQCAGGIHAFPLCVTGHLQWVRGKESERAEERRLGEGKKSGKGSSPTVVLRTRDARWPLVLFGASHGREEVRRVHAHALQRAQPPVATRRTVEEGRVWSYSRMWRGDPSVRIASACP